MVLMNGRGTKRSAGRFGKLRYLAYLLIFFVSFIAVTIAQSGQIINPAQTCIVPISSSSSSSASSFLTNCLNATVISSATIVALLFSFFIIALAYLLGQVVNIEQLRGWYKNELWELTKTLILIGMIYLVIILMSSLANGFEIANNVGLSSISSSCSSAQNFDMIYCAAEQYLNIQTILTQKALLAVTGTSIGIQDAKSLRLNTFDGVTIPIPDTDTELKYTYILSYNPLKSDVLDTSITSGESYVKNTFLLLISPMYLFANIFYEIFYVVVYLSLGILIPMGIVFRAIPFLRNVGGTLIALGITGAVLVPLTLVVLNAPVSDFIVNHYYSSMPPIPSQYNGCQNMGLGVVNLCNLMTVVPQTIFSSTQSILIKPLFGNPGANGYNAATISLFTGAITTVNMLNYYTIPLIVNLILFIADFVLIYALAQGIATQLGGSLRLSLGGKMKIS